MNFLKTAFAILASVLLVGTQPVFAVGHDAAPATSQECGCCACKQIDCCIAPTPTPQPVPAAPARTISQSNLQIIAAVVSLLIHVPEKAAATVSFAVSSSLPVNDVPLYEWNCSYLI